MRFHTGTLRLAIDDAWRTELDAHSRRVVGAVTWPGLIRFGYARAPRESPGRRTGT